MLIIEFLELVLSIKISTIEFHLRSKVEQEISQQHRKKVGVVIIILIFTKLFLIKYIFANVRLF